MTNSDRIICVWVDIGARALINTKQEFHSLGRDFQYENYVIETVSGKRVTSFIITSHEIIQNSKKVSTFFIVNIWSALLYE
jgi:hypothetical protein